MSENSKIEWCDHTFNPWEGCQKVGPGCDHCYAETHNARFGGGTAVNWGAGAPRRRTSAANWRKPLHWNRDGTFYALHRRRQRVFCASLADVFDNAVDPAWRADLFRLIADTPNLDWLLLTKRIGNVESMVQEVTDHVFSPDPLRPARLPDNVWLGATIVNQAEADRDIPKLLAVPARVRFLSMEPLLGPVALRDDWIDRNPARGRFGCVMPGDPASTRYGMPPTIDWVIVGGESGPAARPMRPEWVRSLRDQCAAVGVPFLFKQWGEWRPHDPENADQPLIADPRYSRYIAAPDNRARPAHVYGQRREACRDHTLWMQRVGKRAAGRLLDGRTYNEFPEDVA